MRSTFWRVLFRVLLAALIASLAAALFREVLPYTASYVLGGAVFIAELASGLATGRHAAGGGVRVVLALGEVLLAWPLAALVLNYLHVLPVRPERVAFAAMVACAVGALAARHGSGRDSKRLLAVAVACAIPVYALGAALLSGDRWAAAIGCMACAVAPLTASIAHVWPDAHHARLQDAFVVCGAAGFATLALAWL